MTADTYMKDRYGIWLRLLVFHRAVALHRPFNSLEY